MVADDTTILVPHLDMSGSRDKPLTHVIGFVYIQLRHDWEMAFSFFSDLLERGLKWM